MKLMMGAALAAALLFAAVSEGGGLSPVAPPQAENSSYNVIVNGAETGCRIQRLGGATRSVAECRDETSKLARAVITREAGDLVLADARGKTIARFAVADGAAWESYEPVYPIYTMAPAD
ncbi:MAG: hypothetical protein K5872_19905 [Rhizobiaceae bacterium]|nr:hypothetical protein [Rhizobiaceae bacterium]MCV0408487.1 hypothetical protein [Rhizobiaceae bacterium]